MKKTISIIILVVLYLFSTAQISKIDSLKIAVKTHKPDTNKIKLLLELSAQYNISDTAIYYYNKSLDLCNEIDANYLKSKCLRSIGLVYYKEGNYSKVLDYFQKALNVNIKIKNKKGISQNLQNIGLVYYNKNNHVKALDYYIKALRIFKEIKDKKRCAITLTTIGNVYSEQSDYSKALEFYQEALKINTEIDNKKEIATSLGNIGVIYSAQSNYAKAAKYYQEALDINIQIDHKYGIVANLGNLGTVYYQKKDYSKAIELYKEALKINTEIDNKNGIATDLGNIGIIYMDQTDYVKALVYYKKSLNIYKEIGDKRGIVRNLGNLAIIYNKQKKYHKAVPYGEESLVILKEIIALEYERLTYSYMSETYKGLNDFKKALRYKDLYIKINDSIFSIEKANVINEIQTRYETEKKEQVIKEQENQIKIEQAENSLNQIQIQKERTQKYVILLAFLLLIAIIYFVIRNFKQRKSHLELQIKNEAISSNLIGQEQERRKIAEELHDDIGGTLASTKLLIDNIIKQEPKSTDLLKISSAIEASYKYIRLTSHQLAHFSSLNKTLIEGITEFLDSINHTQSAVVTYKNNLNIELNKIEENYKIAIYRTIQELIINAVKHAQAQNITLIISNKENILKIVVLDDGKGFLDNKKQGIGISNIKNRLLAIKGSIDIKSEENDGTVIKVEIPLDKSIC